MTARADEAWLEALYLRLEKPVFNVVYRWLWNREEARDVTQEAFMKVWAARARVELAQAEPLVFRAALNLAANRLRGRRFWRWATLEPLRDAPADAPPPDTALDQEQQRARVRAAIDALPAKLKAVVVMCELSGMSYEQISQALDIPVGTVGSRRSLAMKALEGRLGPLEEA